MVNASYDGERQDGGHPAGRASSSKKKSFIVRVSYCRTMS